MFPWSDYHAGNIDWLLELTGAFDQRLLDVEAKNEEQDGRLDAHDVLIDDLRDDLDAEIAARIAGDDSLSNRITSEVSARIAGDSRLQGNIDAEATARANADTTLQTNIDNEATARQNGDNTLQTNLNAAITTVMANLQQEQNNRITMDEGLLNMINGEITNRTNADTAINTRIDNLPTPETVIANPSGTGTTDLSKLQVGSTIYNVPSGGGSGTDVEANPSGTATADLTKLRVGTDIYSIPTAGYYAVPYNLYILFDFDENDEYRVRYVMAGPNEDPSTLTWTNACTSGAGVDLFVMYLRAAMYNETRQGYLRKSFKIILIDSVDYPKPNGNMWEPTDINGDSHDAPYIYPEIITHRDGTVGQYPGGRYKAELLWDGNKLEFTYINNGGIDPGVLKYNEFDDDPIYAKVNSSGYIVDNHDSSQYPGYYQLTASKLSVIYDTDDNPYHLWDWNVDDPTNEMPILYRFISAASTTGYTVKTMVLVADTTTSPYRFKVAKIITENVT